MNVEQLVESSDVERRTRIHAALADPTRLRIADHLGSGDASPTELQKVLAMPSNLVAHHLRVLGEAGLVTRQRSEADRRRTYLRLVPEALDGLIPQGATPVTRVVFVCTANSARSQLATALWQQASTVPVASAGTHPANRVAPQAMATASRHGLTLGNAKPTLLSEILISEDLVVTVCDNAHEEIHAQQHCLHWSVPDPVRVGTDASFDTAYDDLACRVSRLAPLLVPAHTDS
jgi:protein-tyrosine-phosphatase/DNA-binding transcriptional ArsR family regulator